MGERRTKKLKEKGVELDVYNLGMEAKKIWEELRDEEKMKENEQKKVKLASELHALVKGNIKKIIFAHDTVRVVECLMAMGDEAVKESIFQEMKEDIVEMSKSKYASFFAHKLLRYGSKEQRAHTIKALMGKGTFNLSLVHTVIHNYLAVTDGKRRSDCIESLRNSLVHMAHSRDGAMAAMYCLWHGTT